MACVMDHASNRNTSAYATRKMAVGVSLQGWRSSTSNLAKLKAMKRMMREMMKRKK
jgi:hypothetical protein